MILSNYNRNSNVENRTENSINNPSNNSITDHDNSKYLENSNKINSDNYVDNVKCNNIRELINVTNSDSNENNNIKYTNISIRCNNYIIIHYIVFCVLKVFDY